MVDCDTQSQGCDGGLESWAFEYAEKNAIEFEQGYPYVGKAETCHVKKYKEIVSVTDFAAVPKKSSA